MNLVHNLMFSSDTLAPRPVAVVLEYLFVQVSPISCYVVGSILALHACKTLTHQLYATGGRGWGDTSPYTVSWCKKVPPGVPD